jgi:hypothetical protein
LQNLIDVLLKVLAFLFPVFRTDSRNLMTSGIIIILVNLMPLTGLVFFGWSVFQILILYWMESLIIGIFNIFKMLSSGLIGSDGKFSIFGTVLGVFLSAFFTVHYGGFMFGHLIFLMVLGSGIINGVNAVTESTSPSMGDPITGAASYFLEKFQYGFSSPGHFFSGEMFAVTLILLSHLYQFYSQFFKPQLYKAAEADQFMIQPYRRIVIMHITIIFGMIAVVLLNKNIGILIVWIVIKIIADIRGFYLDSRKTPAGARKRSLL